MCCHPLHAGGTATDAEALMRSLYSAYALGLDDYLQHSWHSSTRPAQFIEMQRSSQVTRWLGLQVLQHQHTGPAAAEVEFVARCQIGGGSAVRLHERCRFVQEHGVWFYLDGQHLA